MAGSGKPILINELICALYLSVTAKPVSTLFGFPEIGIQLKMGFYPLCSGCGLNSCFVSNRALSHLCANIIGITGLIGCCSVQCVQRHFDLSVDSASGKCGMTGK